MRGERSLSRPESSLRQPVTTGARHESVRRASVPGLRGTSRLHSSAGAALAPFRLRMRGPRLGGRAAEGTAAAGAQPGWQLGCQERGSVQLWHQYG